MILDRETLELLHRRDALLATRVDEMADNLSQERQRVEYDRNEARLIERRILARVADAAEHGAMPGLRFDGFQFGNPLHLLFTDIDAVNPATGEPNPAHGGTITINLAAERDAQRARFAAGQLAPVTA